MGKGRSVATRSKSKPRDCGRAPRRGGPIKGNSSTPIKKRKATIYPLIWKEGCGGSDPPPKTKLSGKFSTGES